MHYIYKITNLINGKIYIGQTKNPSGRWLSHKSASKKSDKYNTIIAKALSKYGFENFIFEIIACCLNQENANILEEYVIAQENSRDNYYGYNIKPGGEATSGWFHSEETKKKIGAANKGRRRFGEKNPFFGKTHTKETNEKNRQAHLGKVPGAETRKKLSALSSSRTYSEETKEKHRIFQTGRKYSDEAKLKMSKAKKGKSWKLIDGKRVWMDK